MKKLLSLFVIVATALLVLSISISASGSGVVVSEPELDNYNADIYHNIVDNQYAFIKMSLPRTNDQGQFVTSYVSKGDNSINFRDPKNIEFDRRIWNPDTANYTKFTIAKLNTESQFETVFTSDEDIYDQLHFMSTPEGLVINWVDYTMPSGIDTPFYTLLDNGTYKVFWSSTVAYDLVAIADLPKTTGNPYNKNGEYGYVSITTLPNSGIDVSIDVDLKQYNLATMFVDDISIFENIGRAYYWTDGNDKFISITYDDYEPVYISNTPIESRKWSDTMTWNLTTNEIKSMSKLVVYAYHGQEKNNNVYSYIYIPDLIFDNIVSVTAGFVYHYEYLIGSRGESQYINKTLASDATITIMPTWEKKLLLGAGSAAASVAFLNPFIFAGSMLYLNSSHSQSTFNQIDKLDNPSPALIEKMQTSWFLKYKEHVVIDNLDHSVYKLNWGQFDKFGSKKLVIEEYGEDDPRNFLFSEIVVSKNGKLLVLTGNDIILKGTLDPSVKPTPKFNFLEWLYSYWYIALAALSIILYKPVITFIETVRGKKIKDVSMRFILFGVIVGLLYFFIFK